MWVVQETGGVGADKGASAAVLVECGGVRTPWPVLVDRSGARTKLDDDEAAPATARAKARRVSMWYYPADQEPNDINATLELLTEHRGTVASVMLGCGICAGACHGSESAGRGGIISIDHNQTTLCTRTVAGLRKLGIKPELVLGGSSIADMRSFWANASANIEDMIRISAAYGGVAGWSFDFEPEGMGRSGAAGAAKDAELWAQFCELARPRLNAAGMHLTLAAGDSYPFHVPWNDWSAASAASFPRIASTVDRLLYMETYNGRSMAEWLNGSVDGGHCCENQGC